MSEEFHPKELYRHPLQQVLERIATAFEEQNRYNQEWIALQVKWHEEGDPIGKHIIAIHEEDAQNAQAWREQQQRILEEQVEKQSAFMQEASEARKVAEEQERQYHVYLHERVAKKVSNDHTE